MPLATKIGAVVAQPIAHEDVVLTVGCSVGVAIFSEATPGVDALLEQAIRRRIDTFQNITGRFYDRLRVNS